jgi:hypothetical protein
MDEKLTPLQLAQKKLTPLQLAQKKLTPLQLAQKKQREMREAGIAPERFDPIEKARRNPNSLRAAINAKCWDCVGAGFDPNPRRLIRECPCGKYCGLYPVRPYK